MFACLILIAALATARVVPLTHEDFDTVVNGEKNVFVKFYAPWCGHCKRLAPEYEIFADSFAKVDNVVIAEVNADEDRELGSRFGIQGYPTLKFFPAGHADAPEDFKGERSAEGLTNWLNERIGTHVPVKGAANNVKVLTPATFDSAINSGKVVFVKFYAPWCGHCKKLAPVYKQLANVFAEEGNVVIAEVDADKYKDLARSYQVSGYPTLKLFKDGKVEDYSGPRELEMLIAFVNKHARTARLADGSLKADYGRIAEVDELLEQLQDYNAESIEKVKKALESAEAKIEESKKVYRSILKKIAEKGPDYIEEERQRVSKFLESDSISPAKKGIFRLRKNILSAFKTFLTSDELFHVYSNKHSA